MNKPIILIFYFVLASSLLCISQKHEGHKYYMVQLRAFNQASNTGIPFVKFSVILNDSLLNWSNSDFDGFVTLFFDTRPENPDLLFLEINYHLDENEDTKSDLINITFSRIELFKPVDIDKEMSISLIKFAELDECEYNKQKSQHIPDRMESKKVGDD